MEADLTCLGVYSLDTELATLEGITEGLAELGGERSGHAVLWVPIVRMERNAYIFDSPPVLMEEISDWLNTLPEKVEGKPWKKVERKFPITRRSLEGWKYLPRLERLPTSEGSSRAPLEMTLWKWSNYPLRVVVKNQPQRGFASASWKKAGNIAEVISFQNPDPRRLFSSVEHEVLHMLQFFMQEVLEEGGIKADPGTPGGTFKVKQRHHGPVSDQLWTHALDPSEFYPKLNTEFMAIADWVEDQETVDPLVFDQAMRWYMGLSTRAPLGIPKDLEQLLQGLMLTSLFRPLKQKAPPLWRKAVSIMARRMGAFLESLGQSA